ncbi:MAG: phasin family protein [Magnetospirillum sp.]|nr:phasin family protein [Magnetospirillum sp.]
MSERRSELKAVAAGEDMASTKTPDRDLMVMTAQMMDGLAQVNSRLISLAQTSWRHTQTAAEELRQCQSPRDIMDVQMKVARLAVDDYMDEARKLGELVAKMSSDAMSYLRLPK